MRRDRACSTFRRNLNQFRAVRGGPVKPGQVERRARGAFPPEPHSSEKEFDPTTAVCSFSDIDIAQEVPLNHRLARIAST
jgi:hypothetical protein